MNEPNVLVAQERRKPAGHWAPPFSAPALSTSDIVSQPTQLPADCNPLLACAARTRAANIELLRRAL